jgi:hypothetical protein
MKKQTFPVYFGRESAERLETEEWEWSEGPKTFVLHVSTHPKVLAIEEE